ncbi:MAG: class I SAM-dependent methyltransferase [Candidatus Eisenbacteria bacterium]|nr:class I SAM-dependent methyltransferase [Candidatus Latescibacterota bacterium]MBD3301267.1 class I SAM-dependent methyltransferase [Candidatus Eisenbacteria bacterium]
MADMLIHSMAEHAGILLPALRISGAKEIVEIGSEYGTMTRLLLEWTRSRDGRLIAVDPSPSREAEDLFASEPNAELVRARSLDVLDGIDADAYLVDGDHNYYTVLNESTKIWERTRTNGRPFLVFYHDVSWPWGRRDLYYDPPSIPAEHRHSHTWDRGVTLDDPGTIDGGFRGMGSWACALQEGGPRNGVLTAIEDFLVGKEEELGWICVPAVFGLGALFSLQAPWLREMAAHLLPYHQNPLLERLERNRLECYLNVIAWQDRWNEKAA